MENANVPSPLTNGDVNRVLTGITILDGEFISHWARPPQCPVTAVTNGNGTGGTEACGAGITYIADGGTCTMQCATGYTPSAATATCANRVLAPVTCNPDACNVGTVTNAAGTGGAEPCGTGITSINDGNDCTVTCAGGFRAHPAAATCAHGTLQSIECRVISPCAVVAVTNAAGIGGVSPCGAGVTTIFNGEQCAMQCATGFHPSAAAATCTSGTLQPVTCLANPQAPTPAASGPPYFLIGLVLLLLLIALVIAIFMCFNQPKSAKKRAVKPIKPKETPAPAPTQFRPVSVMMPTYVQAPHMVQAQPRVNTSFNAGPPMAQAVQITPSQSLQSLQQPLTPNYRAQSPSRLAGGV